MFICAGLREEEVRFCNIWLALLACPAAFPEGGLVETREGAVVLGTALQPQA